MKVLLIATAVALLQLPISLSASATTSQPAPVAQVQLDNDASEVSKNKNKRKKKRKCKRGPRGPKLEAIQLLSNIDDDGPRKKRKNRKPCKPKPQPEPETPAPTVEGSSNGGCPKRYGQMYTVEEVSATLSKRTTWYVADDCRCASLTRIWTDKQCRILENVTYE